jgi:hypothetical protein
MGRMGRMGRLKNKIALSEEGNRVVKLSRQQAFLLDVLRDPSSISMTVDEICTKAGVSKPTFFRSVNDEDFVKAVKQEVKGIVNASLLPVTNRLREQALTAKNHRWAQILLEMGEVYTPAMKAPSHPVQINFVVNFERPSKEKFKTITQGDIVQGEFQEVN